MKKFVYICKAILHKNENINPNMAKELMFKLAGTDYVAAPVKLESKKIYDRSDIVAPGRGGEVCGSDYLSSNDAHVIRMSYLNSESDRL